MVPALFRPARELSALLGASLILLAPGLFAATPPNAVSMAPRGLTPNGTYALSQIEAVDAVSGNLSLHIPLASFPPVPGGSGLDVSLTYNSSIWAWQGPELKPGIIWSLTDPGGWTYSFNYGLEVDAYYNPSEQPLNVFYRYRMLMPDGSSHLLHVLNYSAPTGQPEDHGFYIYNLPNASGGTEAGTKTLYSTDGSYLQVITSGATLWRTWTLRFPDGRTVNGVGLTSTSMSDKEGHTVFIDRYTDPNTGDPTVRLTGPLGRTITVDQSSGGDIITQAGYGGQQLTSTVQFTGVATSGSRPYTPAWGPWEINSDCPPNQNQCYATGAFSEVQSITFANGLVHSFTYDGSVHGNGTMGWCQLSGMTLPSGASVAYSYASQIPSGPSNVKQIFPITSKTLSWTDENSSPGLQRQEVTSYSFPGPYSIITNPDGSQVKQYFYGDGATGSPSPSYLPGSWGGEWDAMMGRVYKTETRDASQSLVAAQEFYWGVNPSYGNAYSANVPFHLPGNPVLLLQADVAVSGGSPLLASGKSFSYDRNGNQTSTSETDWAPYANVVHGDGGYLLGINGATTARTTQNTYLNGATSTASGSTDDANGYWNSRSVQLLGLVSRAVVSGAGSGAVTEFQYDAGSLSHGNVTQERHWSSAFGSASNPLVGCPQSTAAPSGCNAPVITHTYNSYGNMTSTTDALGYAANFTYNSAGACLTARNMGSASRHYSYGECDFYTGLPSSETDVDHSITRTFDYDQFGRATSITETGAGITRHRATVYNDSDRQVTSKADLSSASDVSNGGGLIATTWYDQVGRVRKTQDPAGNVVQTRYYTPPLGQTGAGASYQLTSNPYSTGSEASAGWTLTTLDALGRATSVRHCAQAPWVLPSPWSGTNCAGTGTATTAYGVSTASPLARTATYADEANVTRTSYSDGLGRFVKVLENGGAQATTYSYDVLDNLTGVSHPNGQSRSFVYSSLGYLLGAGNPESGLVCYTYDLNGNLKTRTRGGSGNACPVSGGTVSTYAYSPMNELTGTTYNDSTSGSPTLSAQYAYNHGWRTSASAVNPSTTQVVASETVTAFDGLGRPLVVSQSVNQQSYQFQYGYNLADGITSMAYPSGRVVTTMYDAAGRPQALSGSMGGNVTQYASGLAYAPHGALQQMTLGNALVEQRCYNSRLQPFAMRQTQATPQGCGTGSGAAAAGDVMLLANAYSSTANNGNVSGQTVNYAASGSYPARTFNLAYGYDGTNRVTTAGETGPGTPWSQTNAYDAVGNRWVSAMSGYSYDPFTPQHATDFDSGNHLLVSNAQYDGAGNQTQIGSYQYSYDAENRLTSSIYLGATATFVYDADGRRVMKNSGGATTTYVYDSGGNVAAEYLSSGTPPAMGCATCYLMADHLGSTRMVTNGAGQQVALYDYLPFGEALGNGADGRDSRWGGGGLTVKFTGKERDAAWESGLDYFGARYFSGAQGRFSSPDPLPWIHWQRGNRDDQQGFAAFIGNPQNFNMYAYVLNNPLNKTDPTGMNACGTNDDSTCKVTVTIQDRSKDATGKYNDKFTNVANQANYNAAAVVTVNGKAAGTFLIKTTPSDPSTAGTLAAGVYHGTRTTHNGHPAIRLQPTGDLPTSGANPAQGGAWFAQGDLVHVAGVNNFTGVGRDGRPVSAGCLVVCTSQFSDFMSATGLNATPPQKHFTVDVDTPENFMYADPILRGVPGSD